MNLSQLNEARKLKARLDKELSKILIDVEIGRNAIKVTINGQQEIQSIKISPDIMNPEKPEYLEKLLTKAINEAIGKSQKAAAKQISNLTGGLKIPGLT